mmetsp:Transcript_5226/g.10729  ORF Transcript_5226/g.10729 Transcript_5226/m.10729 type:complete len:851 (+) Transcript_5226:275-2827(+)
MPSRVSSDPLTIKLIRDYNMATDEKDSSSPPKKKARASPPASIEEAELLNGIADKNTGNNRAEGRDTKETASERSADDESSAGSEHLPKDEDEGAAQDVSGDGSSKQKKSVPQSSSSSDSKKVPPIPQQLVDHTYTDYAIVDEDDLHLLDENPSLLPKASSAAEEKIREELKGMTCTYGPMKKNAGGVVQPFPGKLLEVLDRGDLGDIVDWMPHGRSFIVKKPKLFTSDVLPRFFKQTKFLSFTRQLNLWGFKRITKGVDGGSYYHPLFLRGRPYLAMRMRRQKIKGTGMKLTPNPDAEPDFYNDYESLPPLNSRRILPPLPPLPADRAQMEGNAAADEGNFGKSGSGKRGNVKNEDFGYNGASISSGYGVGLGPGGMPPMMGGLMDHHRYPYGPYDAGPPSLYGPGGDALRQPYPGFGYGRPPYSTGYPPQGRGPGGPWGCSGGGGGPGGDDVLMAPGVNSYEASRIRYLEGTGGIPHHPANANSSNDPLHDELNSMSSRSRHGGSHPRPSGAVNSSGLVASGMPGMYPPPPPGHPASDRFFAERLRALDRAAQLKNDQQDIHMMRRSRMLEEQGGGVGGGPGGFGPNRYFDYGHPMNYGASGGMPLGPHGSQGGGAGLDGGYPPLNGNIDISEELREADQFEEMARIKRAKVALLQQKMSMENANVADAGVEVPSGADSVSAPDAARGATSDDDKRSSPGVVASSNTDEQEKLQDDPKSSKDEVPKPQDASKAKPKKEEPEKPKQERKFKKLETSAKDEKQGEPTEEKPYENKSDSPPKEQSKNEPSKTSSGPQSPDTSKKHATDDGNTITPAAESTADAEVSPSADGSDDPNAEGRSSFGRPFGRRD